MVCKRLLATCKVVGVYQREEVRCQVVLVLLKKINEFRWAECVLRWAVFTLWGGLRLYYRRSAFDLKNLAVTDSPTAPSCFPCRPSSDDLQTFLPALCEACGLAILFTSEMQPFYLQMPSYLDQLFLDLEVRSCLGE